MFLILSSYFADIWFNWKIANMKILYTPDSFSHLYSIVCFHVGEPVGRYRHALGVVSSVHLPVSPCLCEGFGFFFPFLYLSVWCMYFSCYSMVPPFLSDVWVGYSQLPTVIGCIEGAAEGDCCEKCALVVCDFNCQCILAQLHAHTYSTRVRPGAHLSYII